MTQQFQSQVKRNRNTKLEIYMHPNIQNRATNGCQGIEAT